TRPRSSPRSTSSACRRNAASPARKRATCWPRMSSGPSSRGASKSRERCGVRCLPDRAHLARSCIHMSAQDARGPEEHDRLRRSPPLELLVDPDLDGVRFEEAMRRLPLAIVVDVANDNGDDEIALVGDGDAFGVALRTVLQPIAVEPRA